MPMLKTMLDDTGISASELSRLSNVDYRTTKKVLDAKGDAIQRAKVASLLRVLNERLGTNYRPEDVEGISLR